MKDRKGVDLNRRGGKGELITKDSPPQITSQTVYSQLKVFITARPYPSVQRPSMALSV